MESFRRYNVERSCLRCHERKVRCDKGSPCNKCVRLGEVCEYPGPRRVKRRPPKTKVTDVVARLEQLERSIATLAGNSSAVQTRRQQPQQPLPSAGPTSVPTAAQRNDIGTASSHRSPRESQPNHGFLVKDGAYIDEPFLSRVLEKEQELQSAMGTPSTESGGSGKPSPLKVDGIITNPLLTEVDFKALCPDRYQATLLWQTFLSRVEPVIKVLHIPTTQPRIFAAINRPESVRPDVHCLLFAVFFGATTAMLSDDPMNELVRADLRRYQQGIELSIYNSSFLDSPTLSSLQAMSIYLTCLRYSNSGRSGFTLRGLTIRAAQSIGLHRDGENFKLSPLECEIRRRIWWVLYSTDARMAEDHGILVAEQEYGSDTNLPSNIDDQNISEKTTQPVESKKRWSEMSFMLIINEINRMWAPISRSTDNSPDGAQSTRLLNQLKDRLHERFIQHADMDIPIQRQGAMLAQVLVAKAEVHMRQKVLQIQGAASSTVDTDATDELLAMAVQALDLGLEMYTDELLRGFRWLTSTYTQFHLLTYILWHLCVYPAGPHNQAAWHGVNRHFDLAENDPSWPDPGPKWPMLKQLRAKALKVRHAHIAATSNDQAADYENNMQFDVGGLPNEALLNMDNWDLNWLDFPDWNYLAQSIAIMGQDSH
ncbi:hypothetical protein N7532_011557 [Penicillium argentinense]|uniref:Zn(2)-C6 fungal-type domain-containing protein n=1 Tax=Penicillium argentinense TaxID=1131581 RepID=A0A9W9JUN1_9EURO|nr:uncharacterized protein N7532_011557 [Penicillium argentinense]KAJ5082514.1 hypothetical protein N7532_011557 [Penicillium argentinense]